MQKFKVKIKAKEIWPYYMQHRMDDMKLEEWEKKRGFVVERDDINKADAVRAEFHAHKNGKYFIPANQIIGSLINAGKYVKGKVGTSTKTMTDTVAAMFNVVNEKDGEELSLSPQKYEIDKRSAFNRNVKARIIVIRPKWKNWSSTFILKVDNDSLTAQTIEAIIEYAGRYVGIGSFRPPNKGPFGRFEIESFKKMK